MVMIGNSESLVNKSSVADAWKSMADEADNLNCDLKESKLITTVNEIIKNFKK